MNSSGYLTVPALPSSAPSVSSIAIKTSSGTLKEHFIFHLKASLHPNFEDTTFIKAYKYKRAIS